jgi:hypothetical protein
MLEKRLRAYRAMGYEPGEAAGAAQLREPVVEYDEEANV